MNRIIDLWIVLEPKPGMRLEDILHCGLPKLYTLFHSELTDKDIYGVYANHQDAVDDATKLLTSDLMKELEKL